MGLDASLLFAKQAALAQQGFLPATPPPATPPAPVVTLPPVVEVAPPPLPQSGWSGSIAPVPAPAPTGGGQSGWSGSITPDVAPPPAPAPAGPPQTGWSGSVVPVGAPMPAAAPLPAGAAQTGWSGGIAAVPAPPAPAPEAAVDQAPPPPVTQLPPQTITATPKGSGGPSFGAPSGPTGPIDKGAAVLLPGQQQQFSNEIEAQKHHNAQDMEIAAANEAIRAEAAKKSAAAEAAYQQTLDTEAKEREEFKSYYDGEAAKLDADATRVANQKIDPNRMFHGEGGTWNSILAGIAMVFGAMGAAGSGGKNMGVEAIQKQIDRDVELQAKDLESQKGDINRKQSMLAQKYQLFGNMQAAKAATRIEGYKAAQRQIDAWAAQQGGDVFAMKAAQAGDDFSRKIDRAKEDWGIGIEGAWKTKKAQEAAAASAAAAAQAAKLEEERKAIRGVQLKSLEELAKEYPGLQIKYDKASGQYVGTDPSTGQVIFGKNPLGEKGENAPTPAATVTGFNAAGQPVYGTELVSKADKKAYDETQKIYTSLKSDLKIIKDLRAKHGGGALWSPEDQATANAAATRVQLALKSPAMANLGAISGTDAGYLEKQMPTDPLATKAVGLVGSDPIGAQIDSLESSVDNMYSNAQATYLKGGPAKQSGAATLAKPVK